MTLTPKINQAIATAARLHEGQYRKDDGAPFVCHPYAVLVILSEYTDDEDILAAGLLHDVLEDVSEYQESDMRADFGDRVTDIVKGVTEPKNQDRAPEDKLTWQEQKEQYLETLRQAPTASVMVAAADKIHNLRSLADMYDRRGPEMWQLFRTGQEERVWYFKEVAEIIQDRLPDGLKREYQQTWRNFEEKITQFV